MWFYSKEVIPAGIQQGMQQLGRIGRVQTRGGENYRIDESVSER